MFDAATIIIVIGTFLIAGTVKGVIGLGLPTVSLALLTLAIDLPTAMASLLVPSLVTNLWQAFVGGSGVVILLRLWPFLLMATITVWIGAMALTRVELSWLSALLGTLLVIYSTVNLSGFKLTVPKRHEIWVGSLLGSVNGILTGMTGSFVVPGVLYLQAINLSRNMLVQAMGMLFTVSTLALAFALQDNHLLSIMNGALSVIPLVPAMLGMIIGQRVRQRLSEQLFRKTFFVFLLVLGTYIIGSTFCGFDW
jgi:uncharacterized membrane protein YfcA